MIKRKIDELNRIVLPKEFLNVLNLQGGDELEINIHNNEIKLTKAYQSCLLCHSHENVTDVCGKIICQNCIDEIKQD